MSNIFYLPRIHSLPGAKLYFYLTATSTPQDTYADIDLNTPNSNPMTADADGYFTPIYLDPGAPNYRVKHTTSAGVLIEQIDDVPSSESSGKTLRLVDDTPAVILESTLANLDEGKWAIRAGANSLNILMLSDDEQTETTVVHIDRTADTLVNAIRLYPSAVDRLYCNSGQVMPLDSVKASDTSRATTTSFSNDPDLLLQFVNGGKYEVEAFLRVVGNGVSGAGGFKCKFNYTGTVGSIGIVVGGQSTINSSDIVLDTVDGTSGHSFAAVVALGTGEYIRYVGIAHVSDAGNLSIQWAQNSSNSAGTKLMAGSYLKARRLGSATS